MKNNYYAYLKIIAAAMLQQPISPQEPTERELNDFRDQCNKASIVELGNLLWTAKSKKHEQIVTDRIKEVIRQ